MDSSSDNGIDDLIQMVKGVSKRTLEEISFSLAFKDPALFLKVLKLVSGKLKDDAYHEYKPELEKWLNKTPTSPSLKNKLLDFYKKAVDVCEGRDRDVELALYQFNADIDLYLASRKAILSEDEVVALEKHCKFPKKRLLEIISKDVSDYLISKQKSLEEEIDKWKNSPLSAEIRQFYEDRNKQGINMLIKDMDQTAIGEDSDSKIQAMPLIKFDGST